MSRVVDAAVLAALEAVLTNVHDGAVPVDNSGKVVLSPLPYVVLYSALSVPLDRMLSGDAALGEVDFQVTYVGSTREQAKWAGEKQREALADRRIVGGVARVTDAMRVRRDDDAQTPDGGPLFYGADQYSVSVPS